MLAHISLTVASSLISLAELNLYQNEQNLPVESRVEKEEPKNSVVKVSHTFNVASIETKPIMGGALSTYAKYFTLQPLLTPNTTWTLIASIPSLFFCITGTATPFN